MHITDNRKARKKKTYADVVKATETQPRVSGNISSHVNERDDDNQFDLEKIKFLLIKDEKLNPSRIATSPPKIRRLLAILLILLVNRESLKLPRHKMASC